MLTDSACQMYLKQLQTNPLRTKMLTSGSLAAAQEVLASWIAHDKSKHGHYVSSRVPKMAVYGAFVSAPLGHLLISLLQKLFAGRTSLKAKILQILVSNLIVSVPATQRLPHQNPLVTLGVRYHQSKIPCTLPRWLSSPVQGPFTRLELPLGQVSCLS